MAWIPTNANTVLVTFAPSALDELTNVSMPLILDRSVAVLDSRVSIPHSDNSYFSLCRILLFALATRPRVHPKRMKVERASRLAFSIRRPRCAPYQFPRCCDAFADELQANLFHVYIS